MTDVPRIPEVPNAVPPGRARWLMEEIGAFLAEERDAEQRLDAARVALRNGHREFATFAGSRCLPEDVVAVQLVVERGDEVLHRAWYRNLPSPIGLLVLCASLCRDGDRVSLVQSTAGCGRVTTSDDWAFGLRCAEQMTVPARERLRTAAHDAGVDVRPAAQLSRGSAARDRSSRRPDG